MPFYKKIELRFTNNSKYGPNHRGLFAVEKIFKGEELIYEDQANELWPYYADDDKRGKYTKAELLKLIQHYPQLEKLIKYYSYSVDDDLYTTPLKYMNENFDNINEYEHRLHHGLFINHSCDPNVSMFPLNYCALRDIEIGEEIVCDYGCLEDASSELYNVKCHCESSNCRRMTGTNAYQDPAWREKNEKYCSKYILKKIQQLPEK